VQVTRNVYDPSTKDFKIASEILEVPIKPGWKAGTRITYAGQAGTALFELHYCVDLHAFAANYYVSDYLSMPVDGGSHAAMLDSLGSGVMRVSCGWVDFVSLCL
jgi:endo-1,4-beta-mannosidase